jgi:hypothetical protein
MNPQRAHISKDGDRDASFSCVVVGDPHVGNPLQLFLDNGKVMQTSTVKRIARNGNEIVVDTVNSRYRLVLGAAA